MKLITLTTDFGTQDGYPGTMKGVINTIAPGASIVDITHDISPQNILQGALLLKRTLPFFPAGCVHIAVIDPGVGTQRRPMAAQLGGHFLVGPDNGLFWPHIHQGILAGQHFAAVNLDNAEYWLNNISHSFHGRDIFAPVGAHLANNTSLHSLGSPLKDPVQLNIPMPQSTASGWRGEVIHVDSFGNLAVNIERNHLSTGSLVCIRLAGSKITRISAAYGEQNPGELVAIFDSDNLLSVAVVNGSAARVLKVTVGTPVEIILNSTQSDVS